MHTSKRTPLFPLKTRLLGLAAIEVALLMSASSAISASSTHRGWVIFAVVLTQLVFIGAVVEVVRQHQRPPGPGPTDPPRQPERSA